MKSEYVKQFMHRALFQFQFPKQNLVYPPYVLIKKAMCLKWSHWAKYDEENKILICKISEGSKFIKGNKRFDEAFNVSMQSQLASQVPSIAIANWVAPLLVLYSFAIILPMKVVSWVLLFQYINRICDKRSISIPKINQSAWVFINISVKPQPNPQV